MARFFNPIPQYLDGSARVYAGAKIYFYENGTTTPQATYSDAALSVANSNPVVCDSEGRTPPIFVPDDDTYTVVFTDADDVQFASIDDFVGADGNVSSADVVAALAANTAALTIAGASVTITPATTITGALTANGGLSSTTGSFSSDVTMGSGANTNYTSGNGADFSSAGGGVFDYWQGSTTFTPVIADASSGGNTATFTNTSRYQIVGNLCFIFIEAINIDTTGMTAGNDLVIRSLPETALSSGVNMYGSVMGQSIVFVDSPLSVSFVVVAGDSYGLVQEFKNNATVDNLTVGELTSGSADLFITAVYEIA